MYKVLTVCAAPSMSHYLNQTAKVVLDKYKGDLDNLRKEAKHDPAKVREAVKAFKVICVIADICVELVEDKVMSFDREAELACKGSHFSHRLPLLTSSPMLTL